MKMSILFNKIIMRNGFALMEYSIFMVVIIVVFVSMQALLKRGVQGGLRRQVDQFAPQFSYEYGNVTTWTIESSSSVGLEEGGYIHENITQTFSRTSGEAIESSNAEAQIGL